MKDLFIVAQVLRPHGRRGEVVLRPLTDNLETLIGALRVYLGLEASRAVDVESIRLHKGNPLLKLADIHDMNEALAIKGQMVCLPREELSPLEEGEYFLHDLVGLNVVDHLCREVGPVDGIVETGGPPLLTGTRPNGDGFMIPFASGTIHEVDLEKRIITLVNLPGLVDNNTD
jgi:16S rRNA processing protein RimM